MVDRPGALASIGNTPIVLLSSFPGPDAAEVWVKLEAANPTGSYKDRMALAMIEAARGERRPPAGTNGRRVHRRFDRQLAGPGVRDQGLPPTHRLLQRLRRGEAANDAGPGRRLRVDP